MECGGRKPESQLWNRCLQECRRSYGVYCGFDRIVWISSKTPGTIGDKFSIVFQVISGVGHHTGLKMSSEGIFCFLGYPLQLHDVYPQNSDSFLTLADIWLTFLTGLLSLSLFAWKFVFFAGLKPHPWCKENIPQWGRLHNSSHFQPLPDIPCKVSHACWAWHILEVCSPCA